jgi:sugar phosphate isomerase/epimerase
MKFAICNEIFKEWNDIARTCNFIKETGYDGIELAPFTFSQYVTDIDAATRKTIVKSAEEADLDVIGIHWVFVGPEGLHINHPDKELRDRAAQYLIDLAQFCGDVGGKLMIFGSPKQRNVHESLTYDQAFEYTAEVFEQAMAAEAVKLIERVNHPNFQLLLDTKAMAFEEEDRPALIRKYAKYLAHYHANDENLNGPGFGDVDFGPIFEALRDIDYQGYMSVEVFKFELGPETIATKSIEYLRKFD